MLDRVFAVPRNRGAKTTADEVALFEYPKVWLRVLEELIHWPRPEDPADDRSGLERLFLLGAEQIDACRDDRLHGIRNGEACRQLPQTPGTVLPFEELPVDQRREELLDEERVSLGALDDHFVQPAWKRPPKQLVKHPFRVL